jgi:hypothetical protein
VGPTIGTVAPAPAAAADPETPIYNITFPVVGSSYYHSGFGACRDSCERSHSGVDIMTNGWKGVAVVAAHSGKVVHLTTDSELSGVAVTIRARGGWRTRYVHLNNDTPGTDDGSGSGLVPGLTVGDYVREGQLIGWVGDSGNAEESPPHVHFEIRKPGGEAIDPYPSLRKAHRIDFRRIGGDSAAHVAAQAAQMAYPEGAQMAIVSMTPSLPGSILGSDGPPLPGPELVVGSDVVPDVTRQELVRLTPDVILIVDDGSGVVPEVEMQLRGLAKIVERLGPSEVAERFQVPGSVAAPAPAISRSAPFAVQLLDDGRRLRRSAATPLTELSDVVLVSRVAVDARPAAGIGIDAYLAPEPEAKGVLYFGTGTGFVTAAASEERLDGSAADEPWPVCRGDVIAITRRQATAPTLTYLAGLATAPPAPLWR